MTPNDYFHNLAISMPVTEDCTPSQASVFSHSVPVRSTVPLNGSKGAIPPGWTPQAKDLWHQYPENWTQLDHNVGNLDTPGRSQAPISHRMENGAVNPIPDNPNAAGIPRSRWIERLTVFENQPGQSFSKPPPEHPVNTANDTHDVTDGRFAQPSRQGPNPGYVVPDYPPWQSVQVLVDEEITPGK